MKIKYPLVQVIWNDASSDGNDWKEDEELNDEDELVVTVGFLVKETERFLWIASTTDGSYTNSRMKVPKGMVVHLTILHEKDFDYNGVKVTQ